MDDHGLCDSAFLAWTRLARAHAAALARVESALKAAGLPPLAWYDALVEIEGAGAEGLRPFLLERRLEMPQYGLSRLLGRLEEAELITRRGCPRDGRGLIVAMTDAGRETRARMAPVYHAALQETVGCRLSVEEAAALAALLGRLVACPDDPVAAPASAVPAPATPA